MARKYALAAFVIILGLLAFVFRQKAERLKPTMPSVSPLPVWPSSTLSSSAPEASPAAAPEATPKNVAPVSDPAERERFKAYLDGVYAKIPRKADLAKLSDEEVHHMPAPLQKAAELMGDVAERLEGNPALSGEALGFYKRCAFSDEFPEAVRALCLSDAERVAQKAGQSAFSEPELAQIPDRIRQLSKQLDF